MVNRPWLSLAECATSFIPPSSESSTTSMPEAGLLVVPLVTVPLICAANEPAEAAKQNTATTIRFQSDKTLSSIRCFCGYTHSFDLQSFHNNFIWETKVISSRWNQRWPFRLAHSPDSIKLAQ